MTPIAPGSRLGPYEIVSRIGAGGMGEVWKARDTRLDRSVAVKVLPAELGQDAQFQIRFEREAKTVSQLNHPHICTLFDVGDGYMVMELIEGESLAARLEGGPLSLADALRYGLQIAEALEAAHRAGIVHRDLKPGNVMLTSHGAKLLDFGLAKQGGLQPANAAADDEATVEKPLTRQGAILGTFHYMAPEQLAGEEADAHTDIWALGCVLYEMVTGTRAFQGKNRTSLITAIVAGEPRPIRAVEPSAPPAVEHLVSRCLAKDRDARWRSANDVADQLRRIRETRAEGASSAPEALSIAVLPFANLSGDSENEYFSDGITAEIIAQLALFDGLGVISRGSVMAYKQTTKGPRAIAEELGVTHVLEGTVRRAGARVRIVPQLVDGATGRQLWTRTYDRTIDDLFEVQAEVAREIGRSLRITLSEHVQTRLERRPTESLEAYDLFLRARALDGTVRGSYDAKLTLLRKAIAIDPGFAAAYAWLGIAQATDGAWAHGLWEHAAAEAIRNIERAIAIDPELAIAHYALAAARWWEGRLGESRLAARRAVELDRNLAEAMIAHVWADWSLGNYDEMIPWCERAMRLDPKNPYGPNDMALAYLYMLDSANAERFARAALEVQPDFIWGHVNLVQPALAADHHEDALARAETLRERYPDHPLALMFSGEAALYAHAWDDAVRHLERLGRVAPEFALLHHLPGRLMLAVGRIRRGEPAGAPDIHEILEGAMAAACAAIDRGDGMPSRRIEMAAICAMRGATADALQWLERAYEAGWRTPYHVRNAPWFTGLEAEERFAAIVRRMDADVRAMRRRVSGEEPSVTSASPQPTVARPSIG